VTLPRLLDADRGLCLARESDTQRPQLGGPAHQSVDEETMHNGVQRNGQINVIANEIVRHAACEPAMPTVRIETQHMVAVFCRFSNPQFADHAAFGKNILHSKGLLTLSSTRPPDRFLRPSAAGVTNVFACTPNQIIMSCGAKVWQVEALSNMPTFRIRMARKSFTTV